MTNKADQVEGAAHETKPSHLFLVRLWPTESEDGSEEWCGKVQHVVTGKAQHFTSLDNLASLFTDILPELDADHDEAQGHADV